LVIDDASLASFMNRIKGSGRYDGTISIVKLVDGAAGLGEVAFKIIFNSSTTGSGLVSVTGYASVDNTQSGNYGIIQPGVGSSGAGVQAGVGSAGASHVGLHDGTAATLTVDLQANSIEIDGLLGTHGQGNSLTLDFDAVGINLLQMNAGDAFTLNFSRHEEAGGNLDKGVMTQLGANGGQITFGNIGDMRTQALGLRFTSVRTRDQSQSALAEIDNASIKVSAQRSMLGAIQNRLSYSINALEITTENVSAAESRIRDADMAAEMSNFTKENVKSQAAQAMVSQANARANQVLGLLQ